MNPIKQKKVILKKRITKRAICSPEEVIVMKGWFERLYQIAQKFEKEPTQMNKLFLLGYISSAKFIIEKL